MGKNLIGVKFGKLMVIELAPKTKNRSVLWRCICDCGNEKIARNRNLIEGITTDCGCVSEHGYRKGQKIARLTLTKEIPACRGRSWECICDCGNKLIVKESSLREGIVKSCGCLKKDYKKIGNVVHGLYQTRINKIHQGMKSRCYSKTFFAYKDYGGRGIKICDEWLGTSGLINFYNWAINNGYQDNLSIDRIDNNSDYSPQNCRWATPLQQQNNTRTNRLIEYNGETLTMSQASRKFNLNVHTLYNRLKKWGDIKRAIEEPIHKEKSRN